MVVALICIAAFRQVGREPLLLKVAKPIVRVRGWREVQLLVGDYVWWSPSKIVAFIDVRDYPPHGETRVLDIGTGRYTEDRVPDFNHWLDQVSPDRSKIIRQEWKGQRVTWEIDSAIDLHTLCSWSIRSRTPRPGMDEYTGFAPPSAVWSPDGRDVFQVEYWPVDWPHVDYNSKKGLNVEITRRDPKHPEVAQIYPVANVPIECAVDVHDGKALLHPWLMDQTEFKLSEWSLNGPVNGRRNWLVSAPKPLVILDYIPSPNYRWALWLMGRSGARFKDPQEQATIGAYPYQSISMWVSGLHGENMRELGLIPFDTDTADGQMDRYQSFGGLSWNPDDRHASFIYQRELYLVDAVP